MIDHLTDDQLIRYQFELDTEAEKRETALHLEHCETCRTRLECLQRKFTALELLREEGRVTDDLIGQTLEKVGRKPIARPRILRWWWSAAAAAAVIAGGIFMSHWWEAEPSSAPPKGVEPIAKAPGELRRSVSDVDGGRGGGVAPPGETMVTLAEWIPERPPFAPASNIELVTLPRREEVQISIYNSADLTLVREKRNLTMKRGWNWLQFQWANTLIDPTSLSLEPLERKAEIEVEQLVFPPRLKDLGRWLIKSNVSGQVPFEIMYFTSGLSWRAFYMGTLAKDEKAMHLEGYVRVMNNSGEDYENTQTRLVVGKVHLLDKIAVLAGRTEAYGRQLGRRGRGYQWGFFDGEALGDRVVKYNDSLYFANGQVLEGGKSRYGLGAEWYEQKKIKKEGLSEYFLYTIEGRETIPNQWGKRLPSFNTEEIPVKSLYKYDEELWGPEPIRFISLANDEEHKLGETPLPDGNIKIYTAINPAENLSFVGGTDVKYIPVNEEIELNLGAARRVKVEPTLMKFYTDHFVYDPNGNIAGWDEIRTWRIEVRNTRPVNVDIEITRGFGTNYWTLTVGGGEVDYKKHDATHGRFTMRVAPRTKRIFEYVLRTYHGERQERHGESRLTAAEVLRLADSYAIEKMKAYEGFALRFYPDRKAVYHEETKKWHIGYIRKPNRWPGDHFMIEMDDATKEMKYLGGS